MAAAEARAAWLRAANRYLVQEDAKRAPKSLAASHHLQHPNRLMLDLPIQTMGKITLPWVLCLLAGTLHFPIYPTTQDGGSNYILTMGTKYAQLSELEAQVGTFRVDTVKSTTKFDEVHPLKGDNIHLDDQDNCDSSLDMKFSLSAICMNKAPEVREQEVMALRSKNPEKCLELMVMDPFSCPVSKLPDEFCLDP